MNALRTIDINADLGEGGAHDTELLDLVTSANIACGGHAGNEEIMRRTIQVAMERGVAVGAHPGYEDRENFGRREMDLPLEEVTALVERQIRLLADFTKESGARLHHVKPHGALYNQADRDPKLAEAVVKAVLNVSIDLILYAPPSGYLAAAGRTAGLTVFGEGFMDRRYRQDGSLLPRSELGAVIYNVDEAVAQALQLAASEKFRTLCVHGDGESAVEMLREVRIALEAQGVAIRG